MTRKNHPLYGLCYVMAEAIYFNGGKKRGLRPYRATIIDSMTDERISHWWLEDRNGKVVDPTADQFKHPFPYHFGKPAGFLTKQQSRRSVELTIALRMASYL